MTPYPYTRERCIEFNRNRYARRRALRHPPSSKKRSSRRTNIWKESDARIVRTTLRYDYGMHQME
jgi:hypothetical protein